VTTSSTPANDGELDSLTSIRGIASFWVVCYHFSTLCFTLLPECSAIRPLFECGNLAVPLFFILSGYVLSLRYREKLASPTRAGLRGFSGCDSDESTPFTS